MNKLIVMLRKGTTYLNRLTNAIHGFFPRHDLEAIIGTPRTPKRGLIDPIGSLAHSLFGLARDEDVNRIAANLKNIREFETHEMKLMNSTMSHLRGFADATRQHIETLSTDLNRQLQSVGNDMSTLARDTSNMFEFLGSFMFYSLEILNVVDRMTMELEELLDNLQILTLNRLPPFLFPESLLSETLSNISQSLLARQSQYSLIHDHPLYYYTQAKVIYFQAESDLYITMYFPLTFAQKLRFLKYVSQPW